MNLEKVIAFLLGVALIALCLCWLDYAWRKHRIAKWSAMVRRSPGDRKLRDLE